MYFTGLLMIPLLLSGVLGTTGFIIVAGVIGVIALIALIWRAFSRQPVQNVRYC